MGDNLKLSILLMVNKMKQQRLIGSFLKRANVKMIPKKVSSSLTLTDYRGIFLVSSIRNILIKLIYMRNYKTLDNNMTDNNMGARKKRRSNNNVLLIQSIIHETLSSKSSKTISLQILDYVQMFDTVSTVDLFKLGFKNDHLTLMYKANVNIVFFSFFSNLQFY